MLRFLRATNLSTIAFALVLAYFAVHLFVGQQGLLSWFEYSRESKGLMAEAAALSAKRTSLEARVTRLRAARVDGDYLEERAFAQLGFAGAQDIVIRLPKPAPEPPPSKP